MSVATRERAAKPRTEHFDEVVHIHAGAINNYIKRRIYPLPVTDADDILAETLIVVWRRLDDIPTGAELPWMLGVARRVLANARRSQHRRLRRESGSLEIPQPGAEAIVLADEALNRALRSLSTDERDILLDSVWDGLSNSDIAVLYEITPNAAAIRLSHARTKFLQAYSA